MKLLKKLSLFTLLTFAVPTAFAVSAVEEAALTQKLADNLGVTVLQIEPSPVAGLYQAVTDRGMLYVTQDGSKLLHGNLYDLDNKMANLTEAALAKPRLAQLKKFEDQMIVYQAPNEKHVVTIFTDITCGYCRKLHSEMQDYLDAGITIRYLAFPRQGANSPNAKDLAAIWCSEDPNKALDQAKAGQEVTAKAMPMCDVDITAQYNLGQVFGINGTPALILADGSLIPGYQPAKQLIKVLEAR